MAGVILLLVDSGKLGGENVTAGILTIATAVVIAAWPNIYIKQHRHEIRTIPMNAVSQTLAGILILIISFIVEKDQQMVMSFVNIGSLLYLVVFGTVITWLIYIWLFSHISVTLISYIDFLPPIIATIIGWLVLGEKLTPVMLVGAGLVLAGIILMGFKSSKSDRSKNFRPR